LAGQQWTWDNVTFKVLYPDTQHLHLDNNSSCVLQISLGQQAILLTGDIEHGAEQWLVTHVGSALLSTVLVVPHHGSHTSSILPFLQAVHPQYAIFSTGFLNRFHFPHQDVWQRYQQQQITLYNTAQTGAVQIMLSSVADQAPIFVTTLRK